MKTRAQLIRAAATRECSAEEWRERMERWIALRDPSSYRIIWQRPVDIYETNWRVLFRSFALNARSK